jgi:hypothetical protein
MPKTKLGEKVKAEEKKIFTLTDIPNLPLTLTIEKASKVSGVGYQSIKALINEGKLIAIKCGNTKYVLPTWNFIIDMRLFPESLLEKIYIQQINRNL